MSDEARMINRPTAYPQGMPDMGSDSPCEVMRDAGPSRERRKELLALADNIAVMVEGSTHPRERCMLRRMVEMLLGE